MLYRTQNNNCDKRTLRKNQLDLIDNQGVDTFLFGSRSQFDELCLKIVTKIKEIRPHIRRIYVRAEYPYISADYEKYLLTFYDETYMPASIIHAGKAIYIERNRHMIDSSDICVFYLNLQTMNCGTKIAYKVSLKNNKTTLNLY